MTAEEMTAYGTIGLAVATAALFGATVALAIAAWRQLPLLTIQLNEVSKQLTQAVTSETSSAQRHRDTQEAQRRSQLEVETLRVCTRLDTEIVLHLACRRVWRASNSGVDYKNNPRISEHDVITVANYLDGIAIGVLQNVYSNDVAKDHVGPFIKKFVKDIIPGVGLSDTDFGAMFEIYRRWFQQEVTVSYSSMPGGQNVTTKTL